MNRTNRAILTVIMPCLSLAIGMADDSTVSSRGPAIDPAALFAPLDYPETMAIEAVHDEASEPAELAYQKAILEVRRKRVADYRALFDRLKVSGDIDKAAAVRDRLLSYERELAEIDQGTAKPPFPSMNPKLKILSATYGMNQSWFDVTDKLTKKIGKKTKWISIVTNDDFGDPAFGEIDKLLIVRYSIGNKIKVVSAFQGRQIRIQ